MPSLQPAQGIVHGRLADVAAADQHVKASWELQFRVLKLSAVLDVRFGQMRCLVPYQAASSLLIDCVTRHSSFLRLANVS